MIKLPFSGALSQSVEVLLPGNCRQFGSNKLTQIATGLDISCVDRKKTGRKYTNVITLIISS